MFPANREEELRQYLLSDEYYTELEATFNTEQATVYVELLRAKTHILTHEVRKMLAAEVDRKGRDLYKDDDSRLWHDINTTPYSRYHFFYFVSLIYLSTASDIYASLEADYVGDECDCLYLTGLLDRMEDEGYFDNSKLMVWRHPSGMVSNYDLTPGSSISGVEYGSSFRGSKEIELRTNIVRRWIGDKRLVQKEVNSPKRQVRQEEDPSCYLRYISNDDIKHLFDLLGLSVNTKPGEWAAAIVALRESGCLTAPNAYRAIYWFESAGFTGTTRKTLSTKWDTTQGFQLNNRNERRVFTAVCNEAKKLLKMIDPN